MTVAYLQLLTAHSSQNPSSYVYDQSALRKHLIRCLEAQHMEPFQIIREQRIDRIANLISIDVYCYCRSTDDGTSMVCCDGKGCGEWFHLSCITSKVEIGKSGTARTAMTRNDFNAK